VSVYNNSSLSGSPLTQPLQADSTGKYGFWAASGTYWQTVCSPAGSCASKWITVGGSSGGNSFTLNSLFGAVNIVGGPGIALSTSGNTITISQGTSFAITNFTTPNQGVVEVGTSLVNPTFSASYTSTPASAQITNTEAIGSPLTLSSPFTAGTVSGTFVHTTPETTSFTLSATQGVTQTWTLSIVWQYAIFGGVGATGASSTVTASGTTAVLSTGDVLQRVQLGAEAAGQTLGSYSPSGQYIYFLLVNSGHSFVDSNTGLPLAVNAPVTVSFVNAKGVTVTMYLYRTTNALYGTYVPKIVS
jgi:hypothetical protein